jgi:hypothetical protein
MGLAETYGDAKAQAAAAVRRSRSLVAFTWTRVIVEP